ncbi:hypothetical protein VNO77_07045 [Canavalia gladiata]|uniref:Uncharacterized protein n=1 Tax=Canavalia gladiata TaxID=3824 RepID=A0AAN9M817_CANGL
MRVQKSTVIVVGPIQTRTIACDGSHLKGLRWGSFESDGWLHFLPCTFWGPARVEEKSVWGPLSVCVVVAPTSTVDHKWKKIVVAPSGTHHYHTLPFLLVFPWDPPVAKWEGPPKLDPRCLLLSAHWSLLNGHDSKKE